MNLLGKIIIEGDIKVLTGLQIGGSRSSLDIGGIDNNVIKTKKGIPYIPGSSLKGKLRNMLAKEVGSEKIEDDCNNENVHIAEIFGYPADNNEQFITRLIVRDACLNIKKFAMEFPEMTEDKVYTEEKTENTIDRLTGTSKSGLRENERVPAGAKFEFEMIYDVYNDGKKDEHLNHIQKAMMLLQDDYLGGSGSRGYGKIEFEGVKYCFNELKDNKYQRNEPNEEFLSVNFLKNEDSEVGV